MIVPMVVLIGVHSFATVLAIWLLLRRCPHGKFDRTAPAAPHQPAASVRLADADVAAELIAEATKQRLEVISGNASRVA